MQNLTDEEVMLKYREGRVEAMDELLKRYKNPIYHFSLRLSADAAEAQDVTQEVFLKLHQHRHRYEATGKFSTWIFSIAHNLLLNKLRKKKRLVFWPRMNDDPDELVEFESQDPSPQEMTATDELNEVMKKCIQSLPFLQKEALILREYEKLDYEGIARILKKSLGTVKTLIHRARMNLKTKLLPYIGELGGDPDV
jgi:RNA polymerase sigma-70 factor (ECF subfamily)